MKKSKWLNLFGVMFFLVGIFYLIFDGMTLNVIFYTLLGSTQYIIAEIHEANND